MDEPVDIPDLRRALERAHDRLEVARRGAEAARREHFWGPEPAAATRDAFHVAMREEADALLSVEAACRALETTLAAAHPAAPETA